MQVDARAFLERRIKNELLKFNKILTSLLIAESKSIQEKYQTESAFIGQQMIPSGSSIPNNKSKRVSPSFWGFHLLSYLPRCHR
jgi:hypothetical protein